MSVRELDSLPRVLPLYARTVGSLLPGASRLPWVAGRGAEMPSLQLTVREVRADAQRLAHYARVCGLPLRAQLPATCPHVLAFPLHLALMANGRFPFRPAGLVHIANRITQHRPIRRREPLGLRVHATGLSEHRRGQAFVLITEAWVGEELVWAEQSTMLHRGPGSASGTDPGEHPDAPSLPLAAQWLLPPDLGRRYAAVSGDRNPIHLHPLSARMLGFPRAIAHGMWTKARCLAELQHQLPDSYTIDVRFRRPILLPATVAFANAVQGEDIRFCVRDQNTDTTYLDGRAQPAGAAVDHEEVGQ